MATFPVWSPPPDREPAANTPEWIFEDPRSRALLDEIEQVAPSNTAVLISGETGTDKGLVAHYLHNRSARQGGLFVVMSYGAFSDTLVGTELFGHENGMFTGAFGMQVGWFKQASGGTIFLDEASNLPLPIRNKLLRMLQEREIVYPGGRTPIPVDLQIVATTTVDLETLVREKHFRKDLYYRLDIVNLDVLTLKGHPGDIVPLTRYFVNTYSERLDHARATLTPAAERLLTRSP